MFPLNKGGISCTGLNKIDLKKGKKYMTIVTDKAELVKSFEVTKINDVMVKVNGKGDVSGIDENIVKELRNFVTGGTMDINKCCMCKADAKLMPSGDSKCKKCLKSGKEMWICQEAALYHLFCESCSKSVYSEKRLLETGLTE